MYSPPIPPHPGKAMDRVPFGTEDDAPAAVSFERIPDDGVNISGNVLGEIEPEQRPRHVLHIGPDQIAVPVKNGEIAVFSSGRGADVLNDRIGHVKAAVARPNNPSRRLHSSFLPVTHHPSPFYRARFQSSTRIPPIRLTRDRADFDNRKLRVSSSFALPRRTDRSLGRAFPWRTSRKAGFALSLATGPKALTLAPALINCSIRTSDGASRM